MNIQPRFKIQYPMKNRSKSIENLLRLQQLLLIF